jgi:hypothetical protein
MLPQPNIKVSKAATKSKPASVLLPHTLTTPKPTSKQSIPTKVPEKEIESEDDDESTDFFGFNSAKVDIKMPSTIPDPSLFLPQTKIYSDVLMPGPSKPTVASNNYSEVEDGEERSAKKMKLINDEVSSLSIHLFIIKFMHQFV